jgi:hypothetical protein
MGAISQPVLLTNLGLHHRLQGGRLEDGIRAFNLTELLCSDCPQADSLREIAPSPLGRPRLLLPLRQERQPVQLGTCGRRFHLLFEAATSDPPADGFAVRKPSPAEARGILMELGEHLP